MLLGKPLLGGKELMEEGEEAASSQAKGKGKRHRRSPHGRKGSLVPRSCGAGSVRRFADTPHNLDPLPPLCV